jgi:hypothetical protein
VSVAQQPEGFELLFGLDGSSSIEIVAKSARRVAAPIVGSANGQR